MLLCRKVARLENVLDFSPHRNPGSALRKLPRQYGRRCRFNHVATKRRRKASHSKSRLHQVDANRYAASRNWAYQKQIGSNFLCPRLSDLRSLDKVTPHRCQSCRKIDSLFFYDILAETHPVLNRQDILTEYPKEK